MEETPTSDAAAPSPDAQPESLSLDSIVERWWEDHFPGSPVAQITAIWNHAFAAKEELKRRLKEVI